MKITTKNSSKLINIFSLNKIVITKLAYQKSLTQQLKDNKDVKWLQYLGALKLDPDLHQVNDLVNQGRHVNSNIYPVDYKRMMDVVEKSMEQMKQQRHFAPRGMPIVYPNQYQQVLPKILQNRRKEIAPHIQPQQPKPPAPRLPSVRQVFPQVPGKPYQPKPFGTRLNIPKTS